MPIRELNVICGGSAIGLSSCETNEGTPYTSVPVSKVAASALISFGHNGNCGMSGNGTQRGGGAAACSGRSGAIESRGYAYKNTSSPKPLRWSSSGTLQYLGTTHSRRKAMPAT